MKVLMVTAVTRQNSLTNTVARNFAQPLLDAGHAVEVADLVREKFDPVMSEEDEPDWDNPKSTYSPAVLNEMARVIQNDVTVLVFPVWWWSTPAILKGWIDKINNNSYSNSNGNYPHRLVWMVAVAGATQASFAKRGYDQAIKTQLEIGTFRYSGVEDVRLDILFGARGFRPAEDILEEATTLGREFARTLTVGFNPAVEAADL